MSGEEREKIYSYVALSAREREEAESLRAAYAAAAAGKRQRAKARDGREETSLEGLRRLEKKAKGFPRAVCLALGILFCLMFGAGLAMILRWDMILWGCAVALPGIAGMACMPPLHKALLRRARARRAGEAERICAEILHDGGKG